MKMIGVTEQAKAKLKSILDDQIHDPNSCLRLARSQEGQLGLCIDVEMADDEIVEYHGSKLLLINQELADELKGVTIDTEDKDEETQLIMVSEQE